MKKWFEFYRIEHFLSSKVESFEEDWVFALHSALPLSNLNSIC